MGLSCSDKGLKMSLHLSVSSVFLLDAASISHLMFAIDLSTVSLCDVDLIQKCWVSQVCYPSIYTLKLFFF